MYEVYFQGYGMAITSDFAGGNMVTDENNNAIFLKQAQNNGLIILQGVNCPDNEMMEVFGI